MREIPSLSCALWRGETCPVCASMPAPVECKDCGRVGCTSSLFTIFSPLYALAGASLLTQMVKNLSAMQKTWI